MPCYFSDFTLLDPRPFSYNWKISLVFFEVERVFLVSPKSEATSLWGVPYSSASTALNLIFKDLSECWCFAAEMVTVLYV